MPFRRLVNLDVGAIDGPLRGWQELSGIVTEVTVAEYGYGSRNEDGVIKTTGTNKAIDLALERGVMGSLNLDKWFDPIRNVD